MDHARFCRGVLCRGVPGINTVTIGAVRKRLPRKGGAGRGTELQTATPATPLPGAPLTPPPSPLPPPCLLFHAPFRPFPASQAASTFELLNAAYEPVAFHSFFEIMVVYLRRGDMASHLHTPRGLRRHLLCIPVPCLGTYADGMQALEAYEWRCCRARPPRASALHPKSAASGAAAEAEAGPSKARATGDRGGGGGGAWTAVGRMRRPGDPPEDRGRAPTGDGWGTALWYCGPAMTCGLNSHVRMAGGVSGEGVVRSGHAGGAAKARGP